MNRRGARKARMVRDLLVVLLLLVAMGLFLAVLWGTLNPVLIHPQRKSALIWLASIAGMWVVLVTNWYQIFTPRQPRWHDRLVIAYCSGCLIVSIASVAALVGNVNASLWLILSGLSLLNHSAGMTLWLYRPARPVVRSANAEG